MLHDNPLLVGQTTVQSRHITELRDAIDALRSHKGLAAYQWQADASAGALIKADPIMEMRTALDQALGAPSGGYTAGLGQGQFVRAVYIQELRDRVLAAWQGGAGAASVQWLVSDHLGTPRMVVDQTGSLAGIKRHDYLPFGEELSAGGRTSAQGYAADNVRQKFTSKERDAETGLDWFGPGRYYSSAQGRFISVDPLLASGSLANPQLWNRYAYALNRPTIAVDPDGLSTIVVTVTTHGSDQPTARVTLTSRQGDQVRGADGLAAGNTRDRSVHTKREFGDTPYGVYHADNPATAGGTADDRSLKPGFGTGKINFSPEAGEVVQFGRSAIRIHGGGSALIKEGKDPYALDQDLKYSEGCVRVTNRDVNTLIGDIKALDANGDPLDRVFIGTEEYLNALADQRDSNGNYLYPDLRLALHKGSSPHFFTGLDQLSLMLADFERRVHLAEEQERRRRDRRY